QDGGPIALLQTGDTVLIDQDTKELTMKVSEEELAKRQESLVIPPLHSRGALGKYAHIVSSSSKGAITDFWKKDEK
ncbi:MAG: dihydroxy-acid dehydratase, partial [Enterococcus aquimarinus]